jgi:ribose/xylose/arabinose/galactoside ABC-type transport system permease subunit
MRQYRNEISLLIATVIVLGVTIAFNQGYRSDPWYNVTMLMRDTAMLGIFAVGVAVVIISGGIDLSAGAMIAFSGSICSSVMLVLATKDSRGYPEFATMGSGLIVVGILASLAAGFLVGTVHTWLITAIRLPPFVTTLASLVGLRSLAQLLNKRINDDSLKITVANKTFESLGHDWWIPVVIFLVLSAGIWFMLTRTVVGRHIYAMGGNEQAARLSGIRTEQIKWFVYCISAMTAALAGVLYTSKIGSSDPETQAMGEELNAIAAAVVGGCSLQGGIGQIPGVMLGVLFLRVVVDAVAKLVGASSRDYEGIIVGFLVVLAVAFNELRQKSISAKRFFPGALGYVAIVALALLAGAVGVVMANTTAGVVAAAGSVLVLGAVKIIESSRNK